MHTILKNARENATQQQRRLPEEVGRRLELLIGGETEERLRLLRAISALGPYGEHGGEAVRRIALCLGDGAVEVRREAMRALLRLGEAAATAAPQVIASLRDTDAQVRHTAIEFLEAASTSCEGIIEAIRLALTRCLHDTEPSVQERAVRALGTLPQRP